MKLAGPKLDYDVTGDIQYDARGPGMLFAYAISIATPYSFLGSLDKPSSFHDTLNTVSAYGERIMTSSTSLNLD